MHIWTGYDVNTDGASNDIYTTAYAFTGVDNAGTPSFKEIGPCETVNCGRGASLSQFNLRVSRGFALKGTARIEAIAEVFNLFNAKNPNFTIVNNQLSTQFMQPDAFAGDFQQPEQRVGQIGFRFTF